MARSHGFSSINIKSIDVRKSVDTIHQKVVSLKKGGSANGGKGGDSNGASGGTANGGSSAGSPANGGYNRCWRLWRLWRQRRCSRRNHDRHSGTGGSGGSGSTEPRALKALVQAQLAVLLALALAAALQLALAALAAVLLSCSYRLRMKPCNLKCESKLKARSKIAEYQRDKNESRSVEVFMK